MTTDNTGTAVTDNGMEQWQTFRSSVTHRRMVQYNFCTTSGKLFSCVARSLEKARIKRDVWLSKWAEME